MSWLNVPEEIVEDYRVQTDSQTYWGNDDKEHKRTRKLTWTTTRYVGCDYDTAKIKADALSAITGYSDVHLVPAGGGQYHVIATFLSEGSWSAWS